MRRFRSALRALPGDQPAERSVLEDARGARLSRGDHARLRRSALAVALVPGARKAVALANPIASDLAVMRVSLWPGLLRVALENQTPAAGSHAAVRARQCASSPAWRSDTLAGIACGARCRSSGAPPRKCAPPVDFFDVKADVEACSPARACARRVHLRAAHTRLPASRARGAREARRARQSAGWASCTRPGARTGLYISARALRAGLRDGAARSSGRLIGRFPAFPRCAATSPWSWMKACLSVPCASV